MAHRIEEYADGTAAFASAREVAWHALGTVTAEAMTAEEALKLAYLDTEVRVTDEPVQVPVLLADGVHTITVPDKFMTYRMHPKTGKPDALGVVGTRYVPIQNADAFAFLNYIADESGAVFETAGALDGGRRVFMSMKFPQHMEIAGGQDTVDYYLMATNSHDGTKSFTVAVTPIRPVCHNTVTLGLQEAVSSISLKHTAGAQGKIQQARETLGMVFTYQEAFEAEVAALVSQKFSTQQFEAFTDELFKVRGEETDTKIKKQERVKDTLLDLWVADTQANVAGTKWAAWNAVVEYADWFKPVRGGEDKDVVRAERVLTGSMNGLKQRAYDLLTV